MVSRTAAEEAVRSEVDGPERGDLLFFLGEQTDDQLSQWRILDTDGAAAIVAFVRLKLKAQESQLAGSGLGTQYFKSARDFLNNYEPHRWELLPGISSKTMDVKSVRPSAVKLWCTFDMEGLALLSVLPDGAPVTLMLPAGSATVGSEEILHDKILTHILHPLQQASSSLSDPFFECTRATTGMPGRWTNKSARSDFVLQSAVNKELLVAVEVKTSAVICVPQDSTLPAAYAAATDDSNIVKCVTQLYSYLEVVPYGVLVTDQQLFCMRREGTVLLCSRSIPVSGYVHCPANRGPGRPSAAEQQAASCAAAAAREQFEAAGGRPADSLTVVAALYCIVKMSKQWWEQQPPQPTGRAGQRDSGKGTAGTRQRRTLLQLMVAAASGLCAFNGATAAAAEAPEPALLLRTDAESECTSSQLFPGRSFDPRIPGGVPPSLGGACWGVVLQGAVGGRAAAVKLVDLWQGQEGKEALQREVRIYQQLQPLQGVYVPHLLGYGRCDGWQYFMATSLEGPPLSSDEGWDLLGEEAICAAAFAALNAVHRCGVLHGDIALRNFVLAAQPAGAGRGVTGGAGEPQPQPQPLVMLLDFGHARAVAEAAEEWGAEPAALILREQRALQDLLGWGPPPLRPLPLPPADTDAGSGAEAAAASAGGAGGMGGQPQLQQPSMPEPDAHVAPGGSAAASRPGRPTAHGSAGPPSAFPPPPPWPCSSRPGGWRQQPRPARSQAPHLPRIPMSPVWSGMNRGRSATRLSLRMVA